MGLHQPARKYTKKTEQLAIWCFTLLLIDVIIPCDLLIEIGAQFRIFDLQESGGVRKRSISFELQR